LIPPGGSGGFHFFGDCRRARIRWDLFPRFGVLLYRIPGIPYRAEGGRPLCPVRRRGNHFVDIGPSVREYGSKLERRTAHGNHVTLRKLRWVLAHVAFDRSGNSFKHFPTRPLRIALGIEEGMVREGKIRTLVKSAEFRAVCFLKTALVYWRRRLIFSRMSLLNSEIPQGAETSAIRSELADSIRSSALLTADEKGEFVSHLRAFPDELLGDLATAFSSDAKEALEGVRFHARFNQVASMISGFETRVQSLGGGRWSDESKMRNRRTRSRSHERARRSPMHSLISLP
jgi:hypothetical protein